MKAVVYEAYGTPDLLELREVPTPVPGDDEVLVRVHAVSINDWDWGLLKAESLVDRLAYGWSRPRRTILGSDIAGTVEAVGRNVTEWMVGDDVHGDLSGRWGGFAEYVCAPRGSLARKPVAMTFAEAAAIPQAGMLALQGLRDMGALRAGDRLLVNGAGGGVGTFAVQLARLQHLEVTGVDSAAKLDMLRMVGYDHVIDYGATDFTATGERYDLILDVKTNRPLAAYLRALRPAGAYVTVGGDLGRLLRVAAAGVVLPLASSKRMRVVALKANRELAYLDRLFEAGKLQPVLETFRSLEQVPEAMRHFGSGAHHGKVVISLGKE